MSPWTEPYEGEDDDVPVRRQEADEITLGVGGTWFAAHYTLEECRREYPGSAIRSYPEKFDRFYGNSTVGPLLVDVLVGDSDRADEQAARKRVAFKREWCEKHDRRYLVLTEDDVSVGKIQAMLTESKPAEPVEEAESAPAPRPRGGIQRPKATV